jgi:hypothetical protein
VNGKSVVGSTAAIFDTGAFAIIGDPAGIAALFNSISGAQLLGNSTYITYTSTFSGATIS